ncbi:MAG: hypothetical protein U1A77_01225 [Pirellulales bacterium]
MTRWICHFAILLAVWQGPVPWCHAHGVHVRTTSGATAEETQLPETQPSEAPVDGLAVHLCLFHPGLGEGLGEHNDEDLGWHFHFRMPSGGSEKNSDASSTRSALLRSKTDRSETSEARSETLAPVWLLIGSVKLRDLIARATRMERQSSQHVSRDFASRLGLLQRHCSYLL